VFAGPEIIRQQFRSVSLTAASQWWRVASPQTVFPEVLAVICSIGCMNLIEGIENWEEAQW